MEIKRHRLFDDTGKPLAFVNTPNRSGRFAPGARQFLVLHYTAGGTADSTVAHFQRRTAKASAHLVIDRDGSITQMVPFDQVAWHAGHSRWHELSGLNRYSIGIEVCNWGPLRGGPGGWRSEVGAHPIPDDRVEVAVHRNETKRRGWEIFPEAQIEAIRDAAQTLINHYDLVDILGHDDIAPTRKVDPGPAFPMRWLRGKVMGRKVDESNIMRVMVRRLNIRVRPGVDQPKLPDGPLERGTRVQVSSVEGQWMLVHVLDAEGEPTLTGWVHGDFIA